jgi:hypothetical protein
MAVTVKEASVGPRREAGIANHSARGTSPISGIV